jgi:hypothetical protein
MNMLRFVAILLVLSGVAVLLHGQYTYTRETQEAKIGPLELTVMDTQTVIIPVWVAIVVIVAGCGIFLFASKTSANRQI